MATICRELCQLHPRLRSDLLLAAALLHDVGRTFHMFGLVPKGFIPSEDTGQLLINTEGAQGVSFDQMVRNQQQLAAIVGKDANVEAFYSSVGVGGIGLSGNTGRIFVKLKARSQRPVVCPTSSWLKSCRSLSADELIREFRPKLARVPGIRVSLQNPPVIRVGGRLSRSLYQFTLQSPDAPELYRAAAQFEERLRAMGDFRDVGSDLQLKNPQLKVVLDRDRASTMGITAQGISQRQVEEAFWSAYATRQVSTINTPNNQYQVILELDPKFQNDPSALSLLNIRSTTGQAGTAQPMVPLGALATLAYTVGPLSVNHSGQLPSATISFNLREGVALGDAVEQINKLARETLPASVSTSFQGTAQEFQSSIKSLWVLLVLAVFVVYLVLGILYESFIHPVTILSGLPSAGSRRSDRFVFVQHGSEYLCVCRIDHADRYRQKERDYDDRLRARRATQRKQAAGASDLRGRVGAFSADHDDHHGGDFWRFADRDRLGCRRGGASTLGCRRRRWFAHFSGFDSVYYAGHVSLHGEGPSILGVITGAHAWAERKRRCGAGSIGAWCGAEHQQSGTA